jgi:hypothetical protein
MGGRKDEGNLQGSSGWVNTDVAAEALGVSARTVRNYILSGDLVASKEIEGINERYAVSVDSLYALRDRRKQEGKLPGNRRRTYSRTEGSSEATTEVVRETAADMLRETLARLETHIAQNAELRARLELTERAQQRVEKLAQENVQLEEEHSRVEQEAQRLRAELEAERSKGFWRRLFGG